MIGGADERDSGRDRRGTGRGRGPVRNTGREARSSSNSSCEARDTGHEGREAQDARRDADARPVQAPRLLGFSSTRRAAVLALIVCAVVLSVAVPLRNYLGQQGELQDTVRQQEKLREQVDGLERRKAQLSDPAQVEVEARDRLRYVHPGETPYVVQLPSETSSPPSPSSPPAADVPRAFVPRHW